MLKGYYKKGFRPDSCLPMSLPILHRLISVDPQLQGSALQICQFQVVCSLAFYAYLRLGEITHSFTGLRCLLPSSFIRGHGCWLRSETLSLIKSLFRTINTIIMHVPFLLLFPVSQSLALWTYYLSICPFAGLVRAPFSWQWMDSQWLGRGFLPRIHSPYSFVAFLPPLTRATAFASVWPYMLRCRASLIPRFVY